MKILKKYDTGGTTKMSEKQKADKAKAKYVMDNNIGFDALDGVSNMKVKEIWGIYDKYGPQYFTSNYNESMSEAVEKAGGTEAEVAKAKELEKSKQKYDYWNNEGASSYQQYIPDWYKEGKKNPEKTEAKAAPTAKKAKETPAEEGAEETLMEKGSKMFKEGGLGGDLDEIKLEDKDESTKLKKVETKKLPTGESPRLNPQPEKMEMEKMGEKDDSVTILPTERSRRRPGMSERQMEKLDKKEQEKAMKNRKREEEMMLTMSDKEKMGHSRRRAREERKMERQQIRHGRREGRRYRRTMRRKAREERRRARGMDYWRGRRISPRRWLNNLLSKVSGGRWGGRGDRLKHHKDFRTATTDPGYYEDTSGQALRSRRDRTGGKVKSGRGVYTQEEGSVKRHKGTGRDLDRYYDELGGAKKGAMVNKYVNGGKPKIKERENRLQVAREKKDNLPTFREGDVTIPQHKGGKKLYNLVPSDAKKGAMVNKYVNGGESPMKSTRERKERQNLSEMRRRTREGMEAGRRNPNPPPPIPKKERKPKIKSMLTQEMKDAGYWADEKGFIHGPKRGPEKAGRRNPNPPPQRKPGDEIREWKKYVKGGKVSNRKFNRFSDKEVQEFLKQNKAAEDMKKHREFVKTRDEAVRKIKQPKTGTKTLTKKEMRRILMKKGGKQLLKRMVPMITAAEIAYLIATADKEAPQKQLKKRAKNQSYNIGRKI